MVLCPIALAVHCTGCPLVKFCPAKTILGDYGKVEPPSEQSKAAKSDKSDDSAEKGP